MRRQFPERATEGSRPRTPRLEADKVWKPGEKLFPTVERADVLAYVKIRKLGMDQFGTGWKIQADPAWNPLGGTNEDQAYINAELQDLQTPQGRAFLLVKASQYDFHQPH